jgi:hypothetical protein
MALRSKKYEGVDNEGKNMFKKRTKFTLRRAHGGVIMNTSPEGENIISVRWTGEEIRLNSISVPVLLTANLSQQVLELVALANSCTLNMPSWKY